MKVVGITGGIGSGKTTVAKMFKDLGIPVYIADEAGKRLMLNSAEIKQKITSLFGARAYKAGEPDRKYIASLVFEDKEKLKALNAIIHPAVKADFLKWEEQQEADYVLYESAILFEQGGYKEMDFNILISAPQQERIRRLKERDGSSEKEIRSRMANQLKDEEKRKMANFEIINEDLIKTKEMVNKLHQIILKRAKN